MSVSGVSNISSIANIAVLMKAENYQIQLSTALLTQFMDLQKMMGEELVEMIELSQTIDVDMGTLLDIKV